MALGAIVKLESFESTLSRMITDRLPRNELPSTYRLHDVTRTEVRPAQGQGLHPSPHPSLWVNGRYVGELACREVPLASSSLTVWGRFQHLAFVIEGVA